jgi:nucleoid-associated protein YgaU
MNKETKVGLLVGLSFIVLFGVILSNHSPDTVGPPEKPMLAPIRPQSTDAQIIRQIGTTASPPEPVDVVADASGQQRPVPASASSERAAETYSRPADATVADAATAAGGNARLGDATAPGAADGTRTITADDLGPETAEAEPGDDGMELLSSKVAPDGTKTTVYIVKRGDCLAKIARLCYGNASNQNIDRIYEANREKMPNKRTLAVGTKLELPVRPPSRDTSTLDLLASGKFDEVAGLKSAPSGGDVSAQDAAPASTGNPGQTPARTTVTEVSQAVLDDILLKPSTAGQPGRATGANQLARAAEPLDPIREKAVDAKDAEQKTADKEPDRTGLTSRDRWRHYQIQKGDTWYGLAARFMGDGKRWHDLYALNDDIVPDATKLRTGVKIRVPAASNRRLDSVVE